VTNETPSQNPEILFTRVGDEVVLVHLRTNRIYSLSPTAARFWELSSEGLQRDDIEARLLAEFDVDAPTLANELDTLLADLAREGLVDPT
jgi:hypothetical protein